MCYLYEVVEFNAFAHVGAAHGRTVDTGIGADFNIVLDCHDADLWTLVVAVGFCIGGKAEAVGPDYRTGMENDVVANLAAVIDAGVGIDDAVTAQLCPVHDGCVGINLATVAQLHAVADIGECADIDFLADGGLGRDEGERVDALFLRFHALVELQ